MNSLAIRVASHVQPWLAALALAAPALADIDPPGPPKVQELVRLSSVVLTADMDDPFPGDGDADVLVVVRITNPGHESGLIVIQAEDLDMDGPLANQYWLVDALQAHAEALYPELAGYLHYQCVPLAGLTLDVDVYEYDFVNLAPVLGGIGAAAGDVLSGPFGIGESFHVLGPAGQLLGQAIDAAFTSIEHQGTLTSTLLQPGNATVAANTNNFLVSWSYATSVVDAVACAGTSSDAVLQALAQGLVPSNAMLLALSMLAGYDHDHPFTQGFVEAVTRSSELAAAFGAVAAIQAEAGAAPDVPAAQALLRAAILDIARHALVQAIADAQAAGMPAGVIADGLDALATGDARRSSGDEPGALREYLEGFEILQIAIWTGDSVVRYCTSSTTSLGCTPSLTANGVPSTSGSSPFTVAAVDVEGQKTGLFFYGLAPSATPWAAGSTSTKCVASPVQRTGVQNSAGTAGACDGTFVLDLSAYWIANGNALGLPLTAGEHVYVQAWFRDPSAPTGTNLSDALDVELRP